VFVRRRRRRRRLSLTLIIEFICILLRCVIPERRFADERESSAEGKVAID
jgi:hypothetical protein